MGDAFSRIPPDAERLELPGFYQRPNGEVIVDAAEVCIAKGVYPSEENQKKVYAELKVLADKENKPIFAREKDPDGGG